MKGYVYLMAKKTFVVDTNVLLSDPEALFSFEDNDVILPLIVIEELDRHKDRQDEVGRNARETVRKLADITKTSKDLKTAGVPLRNGGMLRILSVDDMGSDSMTMAASGRIAQAMCCTCASATCGARRHGSAAALDYGMSLAICGTTSRRLRAAGTCHSASRS
jgi:hypothetical protein